MIKKYGLMFTMLLASVMLPFASVTATEDTTMQMSDTTQTSQTDTKYDIQEDVKATDFQKKLEERLAVRKEALKIKLTKAQETRVKARCKASQSLINKVAAKAKETKTTRDEIYSKIITRASELSVKLKADDKDTTKLDQNITELQALVDTFKTDLQNLRQTATDVSALDCTSDPVSFKASLDTLRTAREKLSTDSQAIRTYVKDNLKPTLVTIHSSIGGGDTMKAEDSTDGTH